VSLKPDVNARQDQDADGSIKTTDSLNAVPRNRNSMPLAGAYGILNIVYMTGTELARPPERMCLGIQDVVIETNQVWRRKD
jgi:hypothetical protein